MDDKAKGLGNEQMSGRGDEHTGRRPGSVVDDPVRGQTAPRRTGTIRPGATDEEQPDARTREIRSEIERTREDLSETVNAIQERLSPSHVVSEAVEGVKSAASEKVRSVADSEPIQYARANPVPTAMIGIGLVGVAWLAFSDRESQRYRYRYRRPASSTGWQGDRAYRGEDDYYRAQRFAAAERSDAGAGYTASPYDYDERIGYRPGQRSTGWSAGGLKRMLEQNPLLVGATTALVGAMVGVAIPETERENQLMGEARDSVVSGVQETVKDTVSKVQNATTEVIEKVAGEGTGAAGQSGQARQPGPSGRSGASGQ
jgi:hypothetical protein